MEVWDGEALMIRFLGLDFRYYWMRGVVMAWGMRECGQGVEGKWMWWRAGFDGELVFLWNGWLLEWLIFGEWSSRCVLVVESVIEMYFVNVLKSSFQIIMCLSESITTTNGSMIKVKRNERNLRAPHRIHNLPDKSPPSRMAS